MDFFSELAERINLSKICDSNEFVLTIPCKLCRNESNQKKDEQTF